ncbi:MAG TPA: Gfo/Idh/MocA family oxidoreductase [Phycisphaerae bacterium]|nr:Gfo/Idh/MocA family oxidoreductase [Phycisphaerae bacterium]
MSSTKIEITRREFVAGAAATMAAGGPLGALAQTAEKDKEAEKPPREMRLAMIGMQGHYNYVADAVRDIPNCRLEAIARSTPDEKIEKAKEKRPWIQDAKVYDDYRTMLDEVKPDIVGVFMPIARMGEGCIEAVRRGCHVASEKPLASSLDELHRLREERDKAGVRITMFLIMRMGPEWIAARRAVRAGLIGEPVLMSAQKSYRWYDGERPDYYRKRATYGGTIPWVAIHSIDLIRYVTGLEYAGVTARHAVKVHRDYPECEDIASMLFEMKNGAEATVTIDYLRPSKAPSHGDDRLRVVGSKGIVEVRSAKQVFCEIITENEGPRELPRPDRFRPVLADFVDSLREGKPHIMAAEDPFVATEVAIRAREAADTRKTIAM